MKTFFAVVLCITAFVMFNMSMDRINFNTGINPWIGLPVAFISLAVAYALINNLFNSVITSGNCQWVAKDKHY